ncbi:MAG: ABC transporter ATP-binding protein [bacterium]
MAHVLLKNVNKVFPGGVVAVKDATVEVADKEFLVIVGPSGCGKSTFLRLIAGLEELTSGEIYIDGKLVNNVPPKDRDIAMVFQNYALYPHMTVFDNMAFGLKLRKYPREEIKRRVEESARILGIEHLLDRKPKALSGGQRQRVAVGRAIVRKPKVFLFDEPLSNLDAKMRVQMRAELAKLHRRLEATIIYVTHDQIEAMTMGDRIVVLKDGEVQQIADPMTLYDSPVNKFVAGFIGSPSMNFIEGRITREGDLYFDEGTFKAKVPGSMASNLEPYVGKDVILGVRPESIECIKGQEPDQNASFKARVELVEPMGSEIILYVTTMKTPLVARLLSRLEFGAGEQIGLSMDMTRVHFFDPSTEKTIV